MRELIQHFVQVQLHVGLAGDPPQVVMSRHFREERVENAVSLSANAATSVAAGTGELTDATTLPCTAGVLSWVG